MPKQHPIDISYFSIWPQQRGLFLRQGTTESEAIAPSLKKPERYFYTLLKILTKK
jgi:hypothetical protein